MKLLSINQDAKTIKGLNKGYLTGIMYLAPYTLGGKNICPFAKAAGCINACLNTAGRGIFNNVQNARLNRTKLFHNDINAFMNKLAVEIQALEKTAIKLDNLIITEKPKISVILNNLSSISLNLSKSESKINSILSNVSNITDSLSKSQLKSAVANAEKSVKELNILLSKINQGQGTLGKLIKNDSLYINLNKSAEDLDKFLKDIKANPKRYVDFSIFGKKDKTQTKN
jgi:hypothetical protein